MKKTIAVVMTLCLLLALLSGCAKAADPAGGDDLQSQVKTLGHTGGVPQGSSDAITNGLLKFAGDYAQVYGALPVRNSSGYDGYLRGGGELNFELAVPEAANDVAVSDDAATGSSGYSDTNVQVEGVDEDDIVKTDGEYIYILRDNELVIVRAGGADTRVLSKTTVGKWADYSNEKESTYSSESKYPIGMYISGDRVMIISSYYSYIDAYENGVWNYTYDNHLVVDIYDAANRSKPALIESFGQDGYEISTRMIGGKVYIISCYSVYNYEEGVPETYIPRVYSGGKAELISADCIGIMPQVSSSTYMVVCVYDMQNAELAQEMAILGAGSTVYMNAENLYVAGSVYDSGASEPYKEGVYTVVEYNSTTKTDITRFAVDQESGLVKYAASGSVNGYLDSQFSMDEHNGYLRLVTTVDTNRYKTYTDETYGWTNYHWDDGSTTNSLYILDGSLNTAGSIEGLAEDEYIYSARFDGDVGYFCTYRLTDPLFAVDLSNPRNPKILSELKISGFSDYLHTYSDGRLFGLGLEADEETGRTETMKLVMFDTSDPMDVTAKHTLVIDPSYSPALYNHKAALISAGNDIIAFPADSAYYIFGYSDSRGFYLKACVDFDKWSYDSRGLYIGDMIYIVHSTGVTVLDMDTYSVTFDLEISYS